MDITYLGHSSFKLRGKDAYVVTDPFDPKMVGLKFPKVEADIITCSHNHPDHHFLDNVTGYKMILDAPGEYEVSGVSFIGMPTYHDDKKGEERGKNIVFVIEMDGLRICHLGDLGHTLSEKQIENLGSIDVLMVPVGGTYTIDSEKAISVMQAIEPSIVVPMHFQTEGGNPELASKIEKLDSFLSKVGLPVEKTDKLTVRKETLGEDQKIVVLEVK